MERLEREEMRREEQHFAEKYDVRSQPEFYYSQCRVSFVVYGLCSEHSKNIKSGFKLVSV